MTFSAGPRAVVVDASATVAFLLGDRRWHDTWQAWAEQDALVLAPAHFSAEVANVLLRSAGLPASHVAVALERLSRSGVESGTSDLPSMLEAVALADAHRLTVYDALYLQLALDIDAELASLDGDLLSAARAEGVTVVVPE